MKHYTAAYKAGEASCNVRAFVKNNHGKFIDLLKTIGPYLLILFVISTLLTQHAMHEMGEQLQQQIESIKNTAKDAGISEHSEATKRASKEVTQQNISANLTNPYMLLSYGIQLLMGYLFAVIAISWHRLILLGEEHYQPMKIFAPQKHEIEFLITLAIISAIIPFSLQFLITSQVILNPGITLLSLPISIFLIYAYFKISFYFPGKAVNASIDLKTSFYLTKGYFWKMLGAYFFASWRISLLIFGIIMGLSLVLMPIILSFTSSEQNLSILALIQSLTFTPIVLYFQPLLMVLGVSVLSNYYQHALQNKSIPQEEKKQDTDNINKTRQALDEEGPF